MMNYLLANLSDDYLQQIAIFFAAQHPPYPPPVPPEASATVLERGRILVSQGEPAAPHPACAACHGAGWAACNRPFPACWACRATTSTRNWAPGAMASAAPGPRTAWARSPAP
jgi:cytochrome c553